MATVRHASTGVTFEHGNPDELGKGFEVLKSTSPGPERAQNTRSTEDTAKGSKKA